MLLICNLMTIFSKFEVIVYYYKSNVFSCWSSSASLLSSQHHLWYWSTCGLFPTSWEWDVCANGTPGFGARQVLKMKRTSAKKQTSEQTFFFLFCCCAVDSNPFWYIFVVFIYILCFERSGNMTECFLIWYKVYSRMPATQFIVGHLVLQGRLNFCCF